MIREYTTYLTAIKGYSENTARAYYKDLTSFVHYIDRFRHGKRWSTITMEDVDDYIIYLSRTDHKPATLCRHMAAISGIYRFMKRSGYNVENPVKFESRPKVAKTIPNTIDIQTMLTAWSKTTGELHTIVTILMTTGVRIQECLDITWQDIKWEEREIIIHGKGAKDRKVFICDVLLWELQSVAADKKFRLFAGWDQRRVRRELFWVMREFDAVKQKSPHAIRHTYATEMAKAGCNVTQLATLMGHNDIKTTQKYIDMTEITAKKIATMYNPLNN